MKTRVFVKVFKHQSQDQNAVSFSTNPVDKMVEFILAPIQNSSPEKTVRIP